MKLFLLITFLSLSFALPVISLFKYKSDKKIVSLFFGIVVYTLTTIGVSAVSLASGMTDYDTLGKKIVYVVLLAAVLTAVIALLSKLLKNVFNKEHAPSVYAGFSFVNLFIYNMNAYGILVTTGLFMDTGRLEATYGQETAAQLIAYYNAVSIPSILLLILELGLIYLILSIAFEKVISQHDSIKDYAMFFVSVLVLYMIQFTLAGNAVIAFICYAVELALLLGEDKLVKKGK